MKNVNTPNLSGLSGEQLLLVRIFKPGLTESIERELRRRIRQQRFARAALAQMAGAPRELAGLARVA